MAKDKDEFNFKEAFEKLEGINEWFQKEDIDLDEALEKYKEGAGLIKEAKTHIARVENEFEEVKRDIATDNE